MEFIARNLDHRAKDNFNLFVIAMRAYYIALDLKRIYISKTTFSIHKFTHK